MLLTQDRFKTQARNHSGNRYLISLFWLTGIFASQLLLYIMPPGSVSWMRALPRATVSIVGVLFSYCLPLLIIAICIWLDHIYASLLYLLLRGFLQGYIAALCVLVYGVGGWSVWLLLDFSGLCISALTLCILYRLSSTDISLGKLAAYYSSIAILIAAFNTFLIKPYITALFV